MSDLARRLVAATEVREQARRLLATGEPYDLGQTSTAAQLERLAAQLEAARTRAEQRVNP